MLKSINKGETMEQVDAAVKAAVELSIRLPCFYRGFPEKQSRM